MRRTQSSGKTILLSSSRKESPITYSMSPELALKALEAAPDATVIIDEAGTIRYSNRQLTLLFGYDEPIVGFEIEMLLPQRFRARHMVHRQTFFKTMRARAMGAGLDLFGLRRDGTEFPVEISLSPLLHQGQTLVAAAIRDVTERKRVESELRYMEAIADTALSSESTDVLIRSLLFRLRSALQSDTTTILLLDEDGEHLTPFASDGLEAEIGGEIHIPLGAGVAGRIALSNAPVIFEDLSEIDVISPVLRSRVKSLVGTPLRRDGHLVGIVHAGSATPRSFTDKHARMLSLAADRISLAIERMRLRESEQAARQAAETANRQKSSFLATASHDLRQPLQTLSLLNGTLHRLFPSQEAAEVISAQGMAIDSMSRLLNALLDISKLESGAIKPDPTDFRVADIFEELRREFASLALNKGLELRIPVCEDCVHSDPSLVGQILRNLLTNAIKYTRQGSVSLRSLRDSTYVRLEVLDTGIGIPADKLQYIYDEFYQVGVPSNSSREGYGLGLSIVQRISDLLHAKLDVQSEVGRGSTFAVTLPVGQSAASTRRMTAKSTGRAPAAKSRVLLVEDDEAVRNATRMLLKGEGFDVIPSDSLDDALVKLAENPRIDLLVTDYHLADGQTGADVIASVRATLRRQTKAILITGDTSSAIAQMSRDELTRVVSKPVNAEHLLNLIQSLLALG